MEMMMWNLQSLIDLDGIDVWWGWKKVILQRKSFVLNQEEMEVEGEAGQNWGGATS